MNWLVLLKLQSGLLCILGIFLFIPGIHSWINNLGATSLFFELAILLIATGLTIFFSLRTKIGDLNHKMGFIMVSMSWLIACLAGSLPYYLSGTLPSYTDAFFEATSGFSGTGASVLLNIEATNKSILLWRSLSQWLGGMGIIVFFIAILPMLGVGGQQLFQAEATGPSKDKMTPRIRDTAKNLWRLYVGFTLTLTFCLIMAGMSSYDAFNHALTTMATGGFSTKNLGIAYYNDPLIDYIFIIFIFLGSINFGLHYRFLIKGDWRVIRDTELRVYYGLITLGTVAIYIGNYGFSIGDFHTFELQVRTCLFTIINTISSTGYTYSDYIAWPEISHYVLILLMVMGGMSGSTAGGAKCIRLLTAFKLLIKELKQVIHPSAVLSIKINNKNVRDKTASAIWGFIFLYFFTLSIVTGILVATGLDLVTASSATISSLSNIGPAMGKIGPMDNYALLSPIAKYSLCLAMLLGRLEFMAILVLFLPEYWRK